MAPSVVGSLNEKEEKAKKAKQPIVIWPEWTEQDIAQEKWDTAHKAKEKEKGKSPNPVSVLYSHKRHSFCLFVYKYIIF